VGEFAGAAVPITGVAKLASPLVRAIPGVAKAVKFAGSGGRLAESVLENTAVGAGYGALHPDIPMADVPRTAAEFGAFGGGVTALGPIKRALLVQANRALERANAPFRPSAIPRPRTLEVPPAEPARELGKTEAQAFPDAPPQQKIALEDLSIGDELVGASHGQKDLRLTAKYRGRIVGFIDYSEYLGEPHIKFIETAQGFRRKGIATALMDRLQGEYSNTKIHQGMSTPEGTAFLESRQPPPVPKKPGFPIQETPPVQETRTPPVAEQPAAKQPWEMTREEYQSKARVATKASRESKGEYAGEHEAPMSDSGSPLFDLTKNGTYPDDVYGVNGLRYYGTGDPMDDMAYAIIRSARENPAASVTVYRAVPKSVKGTGDQIIKDGDWVTIVRDYAKEHGEGALSGDYRIVSRSVRARSLFTNGDSWLEWGLDTQPQDAHRTLVGRAFKQGKPVPPEVLKDYPHLAAKQPAPPPVPPVEPARELGKTEAQAFPETQPLPVQETPPVQEIRTPSVAERPAAKQPWEMTRKEFVKESQGGVRPAIRWGDKTYWRDDLVTHPSVFDELVPPHLKSEQAVGKMPEWESGWVDKKTGKWLSRQESPQYEAAFANQEAIAQHLNAVEDAMREGKTGAGIDELRNVREKIAKADSPPVPPVPELGTLVPEKGTVRDARDALIAQGVPRAQAHKMAKGTAEGATELHSGIPVGKGAQAIYDLLPARMRESINFVREGLKQARNRLRTPEAKELGRLIEMRADPLMNRRQGETYEALRKEGFHDVAKAENESLLADRLEGKAPQTDLSRGIRKIFDTMWHKAKAVGVEVAGFRENYFPRIWKREIAEVVFDDLKALERKHGELAEMGMADNERIGKIIEAVVSSGDVREQTKQAILHLLKTKQAKDFADAWRQVRKQANTDLFEPFGNIEKRRTLEFPDEFYDRHAGRVIGQYVHSWAKRLAEVETFGAKNEKATKLLNAVLEQNPAEHRVARQVLDSWSGQLEKDARLSPGAQAATELFTGFEVATKIGGGFGALKNVFQTAISTETGWLRTLRSMSKLLDPERRSLVRESGATNKLVHEALTGYVPTTKTGRAAQTALTVSGFHGMNVGNQYVAASTAADFIPELHRIANSKGGLLGIRRVEWARDKLTQYGLNYRDKLTPQRLKEGMFRFATDSQLQKNVLSDALSANHPKSRPFWLFKRFGFRQFTYIKDLMKREVSHGNLLPILRLAAGGTLAGAAEREAERLLRGFLSGDMQQRDEQDTLDWVLDNLAAVGAWSIMTDIAGSENRLKSVGFAVTPIQLQELSNTWDLMTQTWEDMDADALLSGDEPIPTRPTSEILQRTIKPVAGFGGTFIRETAKRLETETQTKGRESWRKGKQRDEIFRAMFRNDAEGVRRLVDNWNRSHPDNRLIPKDVSPREFAEWRVRRGKDEPRPKSGGSGIPPIPRVPSIPRVPRQ
jgi:hypothetical protein